LSWAHDGFAANCGGVGHGRIAEDQRHAQSQGTRTPRARGMLELVKQGQLPYTPVILSWLSSQLDKPGRLITQAEVDQLVAASSKSSAGGGAGPRGRARVGVFAAVVERARKRLPVPPTFGASPSRGLPQGRFAEATSVAPQPSRRPEYLCVQLFGVRPHAVFADAAAAQLVLDQPQRLRLHGRRGRRWRGSVGPQSVPPRTLLVIDSRSTSIVHPPEPKTGWLPS